MAFSQSNPNESGKRPANGFDEFAPSMDSQPSIAESYESESGSSGNVGGSDAVAASRREQQLRAINQAMVAAFGEIVGVLARAPGYKDLALADLEWLVLPAILTNQFRIASGRMKGSPTLQLPVGVALWANVSPEVAERLEEARRNARICRLMPKDWQSGDILWLIDIVGPRELHEPMLAQLMQTAFKGREFRGFGTRR